jgi:hypothetical protein
MLRQVLVTSWDPLRVWWWGTCYLRFAAERYDAASTDIFSHLTNNSVTKHFTGDLPNGEPASCVALPIGRAAQMSDNCLLALVAIPAVLGYCPISGCVSQSCSPHEM